MSIENSKNSGFPALETMLSSVIRIMTNYMLEPDMSQFITLLRVLEFIKNHPDFSKNRLLMTALEQLYEVSRKQVKFADYPEVKKSVTKPVH